MNRRTISGGGGGTSVWNGSATPTSSTCPSHSGHDSGRGTSNLLVHALRPRAGVPDPIRLPRLPPGPPRLLLRVSLGERRGLALPCALKLVDPREQALLGVLMPRDPLQEPADPSLRLVEAALRGSSSGSASGRPPRRPAPCAAGRVRAERGHLRAHFVAKAESQVADLPWVVEGLAQGSASGNKVVCCTTTQSTIRRANHSPLLKRGPAECPRRPRH